jgi:BASS family bile acid:Na+ symporter
MDTKTVFIFALILGILCPQYSSMFERYLVFMLIILMFLSLLDLEFTRKIGNRRDILLILFFSYIVLGGFLIISGSFLELEFFEGFVVLAVFPPAVAVIPFTYILKGDLRLSLIGESVAYLSSIFIAPIIIFIIFGERVSYSGLLKTLFEFIILPMLLAFLVSKTRLHAKIKNNKEHIITLLMFIVIYTIIGINSDEFFKTEMIYLFIIGFLKSFVIGFSVFHILKKTEMKKRITLTLFSTFKNCALSAAIALELFGQRASLSCVIVIPFEILFFIVLSFVVRREK